MTRELDWTLKARGEDIPAKLLQYTERRVQKLGRHFGDIQSVDIAVRQERGMYVVELTLVGDGTLLRSQERSGDLRAAIEAVTDKVERQSLRYKARLRNEHRRTPTAKVAIEDEEPEAGGEEPFSPQIVRRKRYVMKPMSPEEAALQMELVGHDFYVFRSDETGEINALYRRQDGDYGLIEPQP